MWNASCPPQLSPLWLGMFGGGKGHPEIAREVPAERLLKNDTPETGAVDLDS